MKFSVSVEVPTEHGNRFVREPGFTERIQQVLSSQKAESVYFGLQ
jgi:hypothetical protein